MISKVFGHVLSSAFLMGVLISILAILPITSLYAQVPSPESTPTPGELSSHMQKESLKARIQEDLSNIDIDESGRHLLESTNVVDIRITDEEIVIDLSKEILASGTGVELEDALHLIATSVGNLHMMVIQTTLCNC